MAAQTFRSAAQAFISYSHADAARLQRLQTHLAMLRRDGLLQDWSDHEILAGDSLHGKINSALESSQIFIALLSADYLASRYCYETEFTRAQDLQAERRMRIIGVVVEPCDWQNSPLGQLMVLPKDGKAVSEWGNEDSAYLYVVREIRRVLGDLSGSAGSVSRGIPENIANSARRVRVKRDFDTIEKGEFADGVFAEIRSFFETNCRELPKSSDQIRCKFENMSSSAFTCTIVNRGRSRGSDGHITVRRGKGRMSMGDISFIYAAHADDGSSNGLIWVASDDYEMFLSGSISQFGMGSDKRWSAGEAAYALWNSFVSQVGVELG